MLRNIYSIIMDLMRMMESSCLRSNFKTFFKNIYQIESFKIKVIKENMVPVRIFVSRLSITDLVNKIKIHTNLMKLI